MHALALVRRVVLGLLALALGGCGPVSAPDKPRFFVVFHNRAPFAQDVTVRTAVAGVYVGSGVRGTVPAGEERAFALAQEAPELVDVEAGWGRVAWSGPEISDTWVLHVSFPDGSSWKGFP